MPAPAFFRHSADVQTRVAATSSVSCASRLMSLGKPESLNAEHVAPDSGRSRHDAFEVATDGAAPGDSHREVPGVGGGHVASVAGLWFSIRAPDDPARAERSLNRACAAIATAPTLGRARMRPRRPRRGSTPADVVRRMASAALPARGL